MVVDVGQWFDSSRLFTSGEVGEMVPGVARSLSRNRGSSVRRWVDDGTGPGRGGWV